MEDVCPLPVHWNAIYERLAQQAKQTIGIPPPPKLLILAGWAYTNDVEKQERWRATIAWATEWGFRDLIPVLTSDMMYRVAELSSYAIGPGYGPMYLPWNSDPRPLISEEEAKVYLERIHRRWQKITGDLVYRATRPINLTGQKYRRLVCSVIAKGDPPWGTWMHLDNGPKRRKFTELRQAVNNVIAPHAVDHIDFIHQSDLIS